ncbi:MAG TPA: hypothetical protein VK540_03365 [Polyangiaceae bacterium]|nr:hypothetical protein [Polyangiaceae bacterium]
MCLLAACATSREVMAPDGSRAHYIECPRSQAECMDEAAELCPRGYEVIDSGEKSGAVARQDRFTGVTTVNKVYRGTLTVKCRRRGRVQNQEE